jgi:hypothetical protein
MSIAMVMMKANKPPIIGKQARELEKVFNKEGGNACDMR